MARARILRLSAGASAHPLTSLLGLQLWLVYAAYQLWIVVVGPIGYWNDTYAYVSVAGAPFPSVNLLAGQRAPLVPLLWKMTGTPLSFAIIQTVIGIAAWSALALTVALLIRPGWPRLLAGASILAFASCWQVTEWNWNILSDSLAVSATAVICASAIWLVRRFTVWRAAVFVLACFAFAADRDQAIWVIGPCGLVLCAWGLLRRFRGRHRPAPRPGPRPRHLLLFGLSLLAVASLAEVGAASSHRNVINMKDVFYVRIFPSPVRVHWFAQHGMPDSRQVDAAARETNATPGQAKVVGINLDEPAYRPLAQWFSNHAEVAYTEFLILHPGYDLTAPFERPALTYNNANGNLASYGSLVDPNPKNPLNHALPFLPILMFPSWPVVLILAICSIALLVGQRRLRKYVVVLTALAVAGLWSMLTAWHGDGMEIARHTLEGNIQTRVSVLVLAILATLGRFSVPVSASGVEDDRSAQEAFAVPHMP